VDAMGEIEGSVTIEEDGTGVFKVHAGSMSVWVNKSDADHIDGEADEDFEDTSYFEETPTEEMAEPDVEAAQVEDADVAAADQNEQVTLNPHGLTFRNLLINGTIGQ